MARILKGPAAAVNPAPAYASAWKPQVPDPPAGPLQPYENKISDGWRDGECPQNSRQGSLDGLNKSFAKSELFLRVTRSLMVFLQCFVLEVRSHALARSDSRTCR